MAISREKKEELVQQYITQLKESEAVIFTDYRGLTVNDMQQLRRQVREAEGSLLVVKNTLIRLALQDANMTIEDDFLTGPLAIGFCSQNVPGVAKAITDFADDNDLLQIKGGWMEGKVLDVAAIERLAKLPPLEVIQAQLLGVINAPASQLVGVIAGGVRQLVNVFNAYATEAEQAEEATA